MKLEQVTKLATPGKLFASDPLPASREDPGYRQVASVVGGGKTVVILATKEQVKQACNADANAALFLHWRKVGPKLLHLMKQELDFDDDTKWSKDFLKKVIADAELVK